MDTSNLKSSDELNPNHSNDAGNDKMASPSSTSKRQQKRVEHELKIMEVEGAIDEPIELNDDDIDVDNGPIVGELETMLAAATNNNNIEMPADPLHESILSNTKPEAISDVESINSYSGPMSLLRRIDSNNDDNDNGEETDVDTCGDVDGDGDGTSSCISHSGNDAERWQSWMRRWPWLLHEESDGDLAFCLYCNVGINVNRHQSYVQQHNLSLYHQERENNYVAFKNSEKQKAANADNEIKYEIGSNEYIVSMKKRRDDEVETLNNFNWERWLKWHSWLERFQSSGTIGLCKCCNIRMNVEFFYLRKRHEVSKGHRDAWRQHESNSTRKRKRSPSPVDKSTEHEWERSSNSVKKPSVETAVVSLVDSGLETPDPSDWCELLPDTTPQQCRCTLCDCRMAISSFIRHLKTKVHISNLTNQTRNSHVSLDRGVWAQYADKHPWLVADPNDPTLAYCHVCCRRFMYGHSEIKRKNHENSEKHQAAVAAAAVAAVAGVGELPTEDTVEQSAPEHSSAPTETESIASDEDYVVADDRLSTAKPSPVKNKESGNATRKPKHVVRHYSWLRYSKDRKVQLCKYCRVRFQNESSKLRHDQSAHHKQLMQKFKERQATRRKQQESQRNQKDNDEESNSDSAAPAMVEKVAAEVKSTTQVATKPTSKKAALNRVPVSMQGKVMVWKDRFPWLSYKRAEQRSNYGWCKLCEISVFIPSFKFASKHQRSTRHVRLRIERKRRAEQAAVSGTSLATATAAALATGESKHKAAMAELQAKYNWLEADATDENHCHCKICDARLPIKVFYLRQHDGSRKHMEHMERLKTSSQVAAATTETTVEPPQEAVMEVDQDSDGALSVKSEGSTVEQLESKRSRRSAEMRRVLRALRDSVGKRNDERNQIDMAFDIVQRLRTLEREAQALPVSPVRQQGVTHTTVAPPTRDTIDLFLDSISQTMKNLPPDLVAEGKMKIMQVVCNLELRCMQRSKSPALTAEASMAVASTAVPSTVVASTAVAITTTTQPDVVVMETTQTATSENLNEEPVAYNDAVETIPDSGDSETSSVILDEQFYETPAHLQLQPNNSTDATSHLPELTVTTMVAPRNRKSLNQSPPNSNTPSSSTSATAAATSAASNGRPKEVPVNIRRILPSTVQVASKLEQLDKVRVVPMDKLTNPVSNQNQNNARSSANPASSKPQKQQVNRTPTVATPPSSSSSKIYSEISNGMNSTTVFRKIHLSNGVGTKIVAYQRPHQTAQDQQQSPPEKQLQHQQQLNKQLQQQANSTRFTITPMGNTSLLQTTGQSHIQNQSNVQLQAKAQLRALTAHRPPMRHTPIQKPSQS